MNNDTVKIRKPHLTKKQRIPRCYKEVEKILTKVKNCEGNAKTIIHNSNIPRGIFRKVYGLTFKVLKESYIINTIIKKTKLLESEPYLRKELVGILIYEMIFGKGLPGESKQVQIMKKYQADIEKVYSDYIADKSFDNGFQSIPKYVRVNTLVTTLAEVLEDLEYLGVSQIPYNDISEKEYFELVTHIEKQTFLIDYHFKDLLVFHSEENLTSWSLYQKRHVFIQDKSSYIPAHVLNPEPGTSVIDACAAPGMKTLHLTAIMENKGVLYAFERDNRRFEVLKSMLESGKADICQAFCQDFNLVDPRDEKFSSVEYILLDPSCSGSGMVSRMDSVTDTEKSKDEARIQKLAGFQIILLKHALLFPSIKRVVYSTCSTTETENEYVVHEVLAHFSHRFKLVSVLPEWPIRGSEKYEFGYLCLRAFPDKCFTNGFFVAMFERIDTCGLNQYPFSKKERKHKKKQHTEELSNMNDNFNESGNRNESLEHCKVNSFKKNKSSKHSKNETGYEDVISIKNEVETHLDNVESSVEVEYKKKSHKRKKQKETENANVQESDLCDINQYPSSKKDHKNKKHTEELSDNMSDNCKESGNNNENLEQDKVSSFKKKKSSKHSKNGTECEEIISIRIKDETGLDNVETSLKVEYKKKSHKRKKQKETESTDEHESDTNEYPSNKKDRKHKKKKHDEELSIYTSKENENHIQNFELGEVNSFKKKKSLKHSKNETGHEEIISIKKEDETHIDNVESSLEVENKKKSHKKSKKQKETESANK